MSDVLFGLIIEVNRRTALVFTDDGRTLTCQYSPVIDLRQWSNFAVGDRVRLHITPGGEAIVGEILPRLSKISRPGPEERKHREQILAVNVDRLLVVQSLKDPDFNARLLDRFLVLAENCGIEPIIALAKSDLAPGYPEVTPYLQSLGYHFYRVSPQTGEGLEELRQALAGLTVALSGPSGVGKSSLVKALAPQFDVLIGDMRNEGTKGRHTTSSSHLYKLGNVTLIDTPGIRELSIWGMPVEELAWNFRDFKPHLQKGCRYTDCNHLQGGGGKETGCALLEALNGGLVPQWRYDSFLRIRDTILGGGR